MSERGFRCLECNRYEDEHHEFVSRTMPPGCGCNPGDWGSKVTPICGGYKGEGGSHCESCEHDEACHPKVTT